MEFLILVIRGGGIARIAKEGALNTGERGGPVAVGRLQD
jgi:hypothetical protein